MGNRRGDGECVRERERGREKGREWERGERRDGGRSEWCEREGMGVKEGRKGEGEGIERVEAVKKGGEVKGKRREDGECEREGGRKEGKKGADETRPRGH